MGGVFELVFTLDGKSDSSDNYGAGVANHFFNMQFQWLVNGEVVFEKSVGPLEDISVSEEVCKVPRSLIQPDGTLEFTQRLNIYYYKEPSVNFNQFLDNRFSWTGSIAGSEEALPDGMLSMDNDYYKVSANVPTDFKGTIPIELTGYLPFSNSLIIETNLAPGSNVSVSSVDDLISPVSIDSSGRSIVNYYIDLIKQNNSLPTIGITISDNQKQAETSYRPEYWIGDNTTRYVEG